MRLGFVSARAASSDGGLWTDAGLGRLIDALAARAEEINIALSVFNVRRPLHDHPLKHRNFFALPSMPGFREGMLQHSGCRRVIAEVESRSDVVVVQLPFAAPTALLGGRGPHVYHVCADIVSIIGASSHYSGAARFAALTAAHGVDQLCRYLFSRPDARIVTNGDELRNRYRTAAGRAVISSALFDREILSVPRSRGDDGKFRVLFVGHLRPEKGVEVLLSAFDRVVRELPQAELFVVGPERSPIAALEKSGHAKLLGPKSFGPELFQALADGDVLVLPSFSEGTPRVLIEARAFGCPVIASAVGGVKSSVTDQVDGLLVPPGQPAPLAEAILRLARDQKLRASLIAAGIDRARKHTVDALADAIFSEAALVSRHHGANGDRRRRPDAADQTQPQAGAEPQREGR